MKHPFDVDTLLSEFGDDKTAWVLRDQGTQQYVVVPDDRYPGRRPIRFFLSKHDAEAMITALKQAAPQAMTWNLEAFEVKLIPSLHSIAKTTRADFADSFVVHSPNKVFHFTMDQLLSENGLVGDADGDRA